MPNVDNIESPVTLISYGRSGSSLISNIFELHPEFSMVGETGNFMADLWKGYEFSSGLMVPLFEDGQWVSDDERAGRMLRESFLSCFPDNKKYWFHKPIGTPSALLSKFDVARSSKFNEEEWDKAATWYWNVIRSTFPKTRFFTILRSPFDVVLSAKSYWGYEEADIWWNYGLMSYLLAHPLSPIEYAVSFEDLVREPEATTKALFSFLNIPFHEDVLAAFSKLHAPSKETDRTTQHKFSRNSDWHELELSRIDPKYMEIILDLYQKFDVDSKIENGLLAEIHQQYQKAAAEHISSPEVEAIDVEKIISGFNRRIEQINNDSSRRFGVREREFHNAFSEAKRWIAELEKGKQWLINQNDDQKKFVDELQAAIAWLTSQRDAWESVAAERELHITALQGQVQELLIGNAGLTSRLHDAESRLEASHTILANIRTHRGMRLVNKLSKAKLF